MILNFTLTNWTNIIIYKCGYSTLKTIANKYIVYPSLDLYLDKCFIVMRDPFERVVSLYKDLCLQDNSFIHVDLYKKGIKYKMPIKDFLSIIFKEVDWHFWPLTAAHGFFDRHINTVVLLKDLDNFIINELQIIPPKHKNVTNTILFDKGLFEPYRNMIEDFYKSDILWLFENQDLIYIPL